jgi:hypothetical protein
LSDFIQIQGKIVMHFQNKGGGGGGYLVGHLHREERGWEWLNDKITGAGDFLERGDHEN